MLGAQGIRREDASVAEHVKRRKLRRRNGPLPVAVQGELPPQPARFDESASTKRP